MKIALNARRAYNGCLALFISGDRLKELITARITVHGLVIHRLNVNVPNIQAIPPNTMQTNQAQNQ